MRLHGALGNLDRLDFPVMYCSPFTPDIFPSDCPTGTGTWSFLQGTCLEIELVLSEVAWSCAVCLRSFQLPSHCVAQKARKKSYWEGGGVVAVAALAQLHGGPVLDVSHPDAAMVATLPTPQLLICLPSQPCYTLCGHNPC